MALSGLEKKQEWHTRVKVFVKSRPDVFEIYKYLRGYYVQKLGKLVWIDLMGGFVKIWTECQPANTPTATPVLKTARWHSTTAKLWLLLWKRNAATCERISSGSVISAQCIGSRDYPWRQDQVIRTYKYWIDWLPGDRLYGAASHKLHTSHAGRSDELFLT